MTRTRKTQSLGWSGQVSSWPVGLSVCRSVGETIKELFGGLSSAAPTTAELT